MITSLENIISMRATRLKDDRTTWTAKGLSTIRIRDRVNFYIRGGRESRYVNNDAIFFIVLGHLTSRTLVVRYRDKLCYNDPKIIVNRIHLGSQFFSPIWRIDAIDDLVNLKNWRLYLSVPDSRRDVLDCHPGKNASLCKLTRPRTEPDSLGVSGRNPARRRLPYGNDIIVRYARFPRLLLFTAAIYRRCTTSLCTLCEYTCLGSTHGRGNARSFGFTVDYIIIHRRPVADYSWRTIATSLPHQTHTCRTVPLSFPSLIDSRPLEKILEAIYSQRKSNNNSFPGVF